MANSVLVETKTPGQKPPPNFHLSLSSQNLTVRELLREYITHQVESYNSELLPRAAQFEAEEEKILNSKERKLRTQLNCKTECEKAYQAFESNQIMILINKHQVAELDEMVIVTPDTKLTFLRLVPLVGG